MIHFAEIPPDILEKLREEKHRQTNKASYNGEMTTLADRIKRATPYLAKMDCSISGEGGHNRLYKAAIAMIKGFLLPEDVVYELLLNEFNSRCNPPWSEKEIRHKIDEAGKADTPDGYLLGDSSETSTGDKENGRSRSDRAKSSHNNPDQAAWSLPEDLPDKLLPVPKMSPLMIPAPFRSWIFDIAERTQCHPEFPAIGALVAFSALAGRKIGIKPKRRDDWLVVPNLWGAVVGSPGEMKSHALEEAMKPIARLEIKAREEHLENEQDYEVSCMARDAEKDKIKTEIKQAVKKGDNLDGLKKRFKEQEKNNVPTPKRYLVNDPSVEKLGELLKENPNGLLLFRDELTGWLKNLDKDGHENDRSFYLESWNGTGSYTYDRIGRGTVYIDAACVSVLGGIQPDPLSAYILKTMRGGAGDDGLMQRIQLFVYPDPPKTWKNIDRFPDVEAKKRAFKIFEKLDNLKIGGSNDEDVVGTTPNKPEIQSLRFSPDAQDLFDTWRHDLEFKILSESHPVFKGHFSKYRSLMPSLALLFHLINTAEKESHGPVSQEAAAMAAAWCDFLEAHSRRIYQIASNPGLTLAHLLAPKIESGELKGPFKVRDIYQKGWGGLSDRDGIKSALDVLEDINWVRPETIPSKQNGGRPTIQYQVNPSLKIKKERAE